MIEARPKIRSIMIIGMDLITKNKDGMNKIVLELMRMKKYISLSDASL